MPTFSGFLWCGFGFSIHHRTSTIVLRRVDAVLRGPEYYPQLRPGLRVGWHHSGEPKRNMFRLSRLRHPRHGLVAHYRRIALRSWATIISIYLSILIRIAVNISLEHMLYSCIIYCLAAIPNYCKSSLLTTPANAVLASTNTTITGTTTYTCVAGYTGNGLSTCLLI